MHHPSLRRQITPFNSTGAFRCLIARLGYAGITDAAVLSLTLAAQAQVKVVFERNVDAAATAGFKFKNVPSPVRNDSAAKAKLTLLDGEIDSNGANLSALIEGAL